MIASRPWIGVIPIGGSHCKKSLVHCERCSSIVQPTRHLFQMHSPQSQQGLYKSLHINHEHWSMARPTILQIGSPILSSLMKREMRIKEASITTSNKEGANSGQ